MSKLGQFLQQLSGAGSLQGSNESFVVHLTKAREKMAVFQKQDPSYCFLKWYQAAVVGEAREVFFEMDRGCHTMIIPFPEEPDLGPLCQAFEGGEVKLSPRDRLLLEGLLSCTSAELETSISTASEFHVMSAGGLDKAGWWSRLVGQTKGAYKKNSLQIRVRVKASGRSQQRIVEAIQQRTRFGPVIPHFVKELSKRPRVIYQEVPVFEKNGLWSTWASGYSRKELLLESWWSQGDDTDKLVRKRELTETGLEPSRDISSHIRQVENRGDVAIAIYLGSLTEASLIPVQHGVTLAPMRKDIGCPAATVVFSADRMETDLSGFHLRNDEKLEARVEELREIVRSALEAQIDEYKKLEAKPRFYPFLRGALAGAAVGFFGFVSWGISAQVAFAMGLGQVGRLVEQKFRAAELKTEQSHRNVDFRQKIYENWSLPN